MNRLLARIRILPKGDFLWPDGAATGYNLAAGQGAEFEICDSGLDVWVNVSCSQSWSLTKLFRLR